MTDTRFMKRSRPSASLALQYLLLQHPLMRRVEIRATGSRQLLVRSGIIYLGLDEFFGGTVERLQSLSRANSDSDSARRLIQPPLHVVALGGDLFERSNKTFHLGFFPNRNAHVIWQCGKQSADVHILLFH